jgi:hypothetical protein
MVERMPMIEIVRSAAMDGGLAVGDVDIYAEDGERQLGLMITIGRLGVVAASEASHVELSYTFALGDEESALIAGMDREPWDSLRTRIEREIGDGRTVGQILMDPPEGAQRLRSVVVLQRLLVEENGSVTRQRILDGVAELAVVAWRVGRLLGGELRRLGSAVVGPAGRGDYPVGP